MQIGQWTLPNQVFVAPMAGVTDRPFRRLCKSLGAGYAVSEMAASNPQLWDSVKTSRRLNHDGEIDPISVQITGADPAMMAEAAAFNILKGAKIIDINMGCPAKKVCRQASGSALMRDIPLVREILRQVHEACAAHNVPVTLKTRTGWNKDSRNVLEIAHIAQDLGIAALTVHGRTRCDFYTGRAEYDTIAAVKDALSLPVIANGDIDSPQKARYVLDYTKADAVMIGRAAQGNPWIFREIDYFLTHGEPARRPDLSEMLQVLLAHLDEHYEFYGEFTGVRTARKHISWYLGGFSQADDMLQQLYQTESCDTQKRLLVEFFEQLADDNAHDPAQLCACAAQ